MLALSPSDYCNLEASGKFHAHSASISQGGETMIRSIFAVLPISACIRGKLCRFSIWLQRRPNSIGRTDGCKRDDRSAPF
jgi:hypothetical protein